MHPSPHTRASRASAGCRRAGRGILFVRRFRVTGVRSRRVEKGIRAMDNVLIKRFEEPDEVREFEKGRFEVVHIGGITIGRATYEPGWKWSEHVRPLAG